MKFLDNLRFVNLFGKKKIDEFAKNHPAPFPVQLAYDHIVSWTDEGELVLDPMCGIGSACLAAKLARRNYIGMDINENYCSLAEERLIGAREGEICV